MFYAETIGLQTFSGKVTDEEKLYGHFQHDSPTTQNAEHSVKTFNKLVKGL
jgi:hypothetical protein